MKEIVTEKQFGMRQPAFPKISPTDGYYRHLANLMAAAVIGRKTFPGLPETILSRVVVGVVGYLQDILTDGGLWRSFIEAHRRFYGRWLPFYEVQEDYIPHELNEVDVRFLVWYTIAMSYELRIIIFGKALRSAIRRRKMNWRLSPIGYFFTAI